MGQFSKKYALIFYVIISLSMVYSLSPIKSLNSVLNLVIIGFGLFLGFTNKNIFSNQSFSAFTLLWGYLLINLCYQLLFGWVAFRFDDILYLFAKISFTFIIITSIMTNTNFYNKSFYRYIGILILILLIVGFLLSNRSTGGRYYLGFTNPNETGAAAAIGFGIFLLHPDIKGKLKWIGLGILFIAVFLTGSRAAIVIAFLSSVFYFKFNFKFIITGIFFVSILLFLMPRLGFKTVGISRFTESYNSSTGEIKSNRSGEFEMGVLMFKNKFLSGYGLTGYKIIDKSLIYNIELEEALGTHNGYLAAAKMYGIIFLIFFLIVILIKPLLLVRKLFNSENNYLKLHLFVVLAVLVGATSEDYIVGINSFVSNFYFLSIGIADMYRKKYLS